MAKSNSKIGSIPIIKLMLCIVLFQFILFDPAATFGKTGHNLAQLTDDEISWLAAHPIIRLAPDPEFQPIEFFDKEGNYAGIGADYVRLVSEKLGIKFEVVKCTNWDDVLARIKRHEVDVLNAVVKTPQREKFLHFPPPYLEIPSVIIVRKNVTTGLTLDMLKGMHVVMVSGYGYVDLIRNKYPEMQIELVSDLKTALRKVSFGMANAFVGDLATASFYIELDGITNLKMAGESDPPNISGFAVRSDWPEFSRILEKGVALLTEEERKDIFNKWIHLKVEPGVTMSELKKLLVVIIIFIALFAAGFLLWNRQLKRMVNLKVQDLNKEIKVRKQAEDALRDSKLMIEGIINTVPASIFWKDRNLVYLGCNQMFVRDAGFTHPDEVIGKDDSQMVWHEQANQYRADDREVIEHDSSKLHIEESQTTPDGNTITLLTSKIPLRDASGEITGILGTYIDISDRKRAEQALAESAEKYRLLFENINDAVAITQKGKYIYFNQQFCQMLGYTIAEMDHKDYREVFSAEGLQILAARQQIRDHGQEPPARYETIFVRKDGQLINIEANVTTIDYKGQSAAYAVLREITERKRAEAEIAESLLTAKQANEVKDQFIANISHEIRTPLNSIIGFSDLFRQRYGKMVSDKDHDIFQYITNSSNRLMRTVDSILNISQLNAGTIKIAPRELDLNYLVRAVIGEIKALADEKGLDLTYSPTDQYAMVYVDNFSIHQAILNITENAVKYTNEGKIELSLIQKGDRFRLSIQDTGIGISEEYVKRIFDPYTQESEGYTKNFQGLGLGLALTKRYLELNDVDLELESQKNVGTTFTLIFPKYEGSDHV